MTRRLLNLLTVLSLLLCVAVCVLWVRSRSASDSVQWRRISGGTVETWLLLVADGRVGLDGERVSAQNLPPGSDVSWGFGLPTRLPPGWRRDSTLPLWHLVVYTSALPLWWLVHRTSGAAASRTRRRDLGLCPGCGYDLTGNVSGVCPECGERNSDPVHPSLG